MKTESGIIIVTGSSGFIGEAVMRRFAGRFSDVVGFDRKAPSPPPPGCTAVPVDLTSDESVRAGLRVIREHHGTRVVSVIHLAAYYDFFGAPSEKYDEITVRGTARLLRELRDIDFQIEQFVFSSTMLVHRPADPGQFINEDWPVEPTWAYPESKARTEQLIQEQRGDIPAALLRIAGVYNDLCHSIPLANQIKRIYERQFTSRIYSGSTSHGQSFMHLDDLVDAIELTVERRAALPPELPVLLGEPEPLSYDELQHTFARLIHGEDWETLAVPEPLAPLAKAGAWVMEKLPGADPFIKPWMIERANDHYALDITRARTLLGWQPQRGLRGTIPKMIAALKADPPGWYRENNLEWPSQLAEGEGNAEKTNARGRAMNPDHEHHGATSQPAKTETAPPRQGDPGAAGDANQAAMKGMSLEEHARMMQGKPGGEQSQPMSHGSMSGMAGMSGMSGADHEQMMWRESLWASFVNLTLGAWLITSPFAFGYRSAAMTWSDVISGSLIVLLSVVSASRKLNAYARWAVCFVGLWLLFAPLVFWTPDAAAYMNDTLVGALVIAFAVLVTMMPGMDMSVMEGADIPPGWSYNPSTWLQRAPIILLALVGFLASRYMAAYQLRHIGTAWDPFFSDGTRRVLDSDISKMFPISDAGLGALSYVLEMLMGFMGDKARWRTMPWMVTFFGILVVPLGTVSIVLIILQPLAVGAWCSLCLLAAIAMLAMIPATLDEVVAMAQFLIQAKREGKPLWRTFWLGGTIAGERDDRLTPFDWSRPWTMFTDWLVSNWNLLLSIALGVWLMFAPAIFQTTGRAADSNHLVGALIVTFAAIAIAEVGRAVRFINILFGAWLVIAPWLLAGFVTGARWSDVASGVALILLSLPRGGLRGRYGSWNRFIV